MIRRTITSLLVVLMMGSWVSAQAPRLRWTTGQVLLYRTEHNTIAIDQIGDNKNESKSVLKMIRRWQVTAVDTAGVATIQLSIIALYQERTTQSGDVLKFDSANLDKSTPQLKEAMAKFLNTPLATIRVNSQGQVVEVKDSKSPAYTYENELPFIGILPAAKVQPASTWERGYKITVGPPLGTGEKYDALQRFVCKNATADSLTATLTTELKTAPKVPADAIPLWQMLPAGELVWDVKNGRLASAKLTIDKELKGHQGEGSICKFQSTLSIQYVGDR
jgi:hypothetical protein